MKLNSEIVEMAIEYACSHISTHIDEKCTYHDLSHTVFVVEKVTELAGKLKLDKQQARIVTVAAWFHDTGYSSEANEHEIRGAEFAKNFLTEYNIDKEEIETVCSCILSTAMPQKPASILEKILCDADMMHLGSINFMDTSDRLRKEWEMTEQRFYTDTEWLQLNIDFVKKHRFHTDYAIEKLEPKKQRTIEVLNKKLNLANEEAKKICSNTKANTKPKRGEETIFKTASKHQTIFKMGNHTKIFFQKHFNEEVLKSERLRTKVLAGIFLFGMIYTGLIVFLFNSNIPDYLRKGASMRIFLFLCALFLFEVLSMLYINRSIKRNLQAVPVTGQYLNAFFEITAPSIIMLILPAQLYATDKILHSPTVYLYFIFIILSTLRLNYKISFFIGLVAAIEFFIVSHILISYSEVTANISMINSEYFAAIGKSMLLVLSGIGAAFVARQIKSGVDRSLAAAEQSNKIVNLFGQQVSKEVVEEMMEKDGSVQTKLMRVCIMFIDIRNFTNYVANKTPSEIVDYQNAFFRIVVAVVMKHKGIINQFLGDGCMVTFGAPVPLENPSEYALKSAMEIRHQLSQEINMGTIPFTNIGIGIHEGEAVTGNIGPAERQQYSITGSVVILAARIEQLNKEYNSQILISENVMRKIEPVISPATEFLGKINLKGWNNSIGIYKVA